MKFIIYFALLTCFSLNAAERPNILWIVVEDMSCHFSFQGETVIQTPHVDRLAAEGVVFDRAYVTCPVCSPSRSALITGMYQTTIGAHNHYSSFANWPGAWNVCRAEMTPATSMSIDWFASWKPHS